MVVQRLYRREVERSRGLQRAVLLFPSVSISTEHCYNVELDGESCGYWAAMTLTGGDRAVKVRDVWGRARRD